MVTSGDLGSNLDDIRAKLDTLIEQVIPWVFGILAALVVLWVIYMAIRYITATSGDKRKEAKEILKQFIIGIVILFVLAAVAGSIIGGLYAWYSTV